MKSSAAALVVALAVASCGGGAATSVEGPDPDVPLLTQTSTTGAMDALSSFVLEYDADRNCLYSLEADNNGEPGTGGRVAIVWPPGYSARSHGDSVTVFNADGQAVARTGVPFMLAGGGGPADGDYCDAVGQWVAAGDPMPLIDD